MDLTDRVRQLHEARERYADAKAVLDAARHEFDTAYAQEIEAVREWAEELADVDANLRTEAVAAYLETGERKPAPGIEIKVFDALHYNPDDAYEWAKEHGLALKLDDAAFKNIAKAQRLDFVDYVQEPKATVATDLGKVLEAKCRKCQGDGKVANTDDQEPWSAWESLPPGSDIAVQMGLVRPITCPVCGGSGIDG